MHRTLKILIHPNIMKKNNLVPNNGLSLSQAQSISNLCNQRAAEISSQFEMVNNYSKYVKIDGNLVLIKRGCEMPLNVLELIKEKAELHACQAFLMENIRAKDLMMKKIKDAKPNISSINIPEKPTLVDLVSSTLANVDEDFGWEELTSNDLNEYLEAEAYASHIGQFIHKNSILDNLRKELPKLPDVEWMELEKDKKTMVTIKVHHKSDELLKYHEELAKHHRNYEQRVNYFKAKVKNITTAKNSEIAKYNADIQNSASKTNAELINQYESAMNRYNEEVDMVRKEFEIYRQECIAEIASMRIQVDARFQKVVDMFLNKLPNE